MDNAKGGYPNSSEGMSSEKHMYSWSNAKVDSTQDYQAIPNHMFSSEGNFIELILIMHDRKQATGIKMVYLKNLPQFNTRLAN